MFNWVLTRVVPSLVNYTGRNYTNNLTNITKFLQPASEFHSLTSGSTSQITPGGLFNITTRNNIRVHFPRPNETRRIKRHGWRKRMSTPEGRRIIMNRILKGRFVYTH